MKSQFGFSAVLAVLVTLCATTPVHAHSYEFAFAFGSSGQFNGPAGVAVNASNIG